MTHSDQIEGLETLVQSLPQLVFRIAALTEMSPKLLSMLSYKNVVLYQNASLKQIEQLYLESDIYLDINHGGQVLQAVRKAFENNLLILGFEQTLQDPPYLAQENVFRQGEKDKLVARIKEIYQSIENYRHAVSNQIAQSNAIEQEVFRSRFQEGIGDRNA